MRMKRLAAAILCLILAAVMTMAHCEETVGTPEQEVERFFSAFTQVPENPLPGDLPYLLWLIAQEPPAEAPETGLSPLSQAAAKFAGLVNTEGVHYVESTSFMGMDMKAEYWLKGDKLKKHDRTMGEVTLFDGEWFYQYNADTKTGIRLAPDDPQAVSALMMLRNSTLSALAAAPYLQQEDAKEGGYDCQVFFMDIDMMGMKGNWLYVDKETGALVRNQYGEGKDGMSVVVSGLEVGSLGDEAFAVPSGVKISGL